MTETNSITPSDPIKNAKLYIPTVVDIDFIKSTDSKSREIDDDEFEALKVSIQEDPDFLKARPPIINTYPGREWIPIAGDKRTKAAKAVGYTKIPVIFVNVEPAKENAWNKKDNHHNGKWNLQGLKDELIQLHGAGFNMNSVGFTPKELVTSMGDFGKLNQSPKDDPENKGTTPSKKGKAVIGAAVECPNCNSKFTVTQEHVTKLQGS